MRQLLLYGITQHFSYRADERVCYLGFDYNMKTKIQDQWLTFIDTSPMLSRISDAIKYDYIDYVASAGEIQKDKLFWWSTRIASKSNLQTDFYSIVCLIMAANELIAKKLCDVFITDDWRVYYTLKTNFKFSTSRLSRFKARIGSLGNISFYVAKLFPSRLKWIVTIFTKNNIIKKYLNPVKRKSLFIFSWIEERSFNDNDEYNDPYFPGIEKFVSGEPAVLLISYTANTSMLPKLKRTGKTLIGIPYYSNSKLILLSVLAVYNIKYVPLFKGVNLKYLWINEILRENCGSDICQQLHDFKCWELFFRDHRGTILYPFENQPWEKMMIMAAQKRPGCPEFIGYQHTSIGKVQLNYHTTPREAIMMPMPDTIIANSLPHYQFLSNMYKGCGVKVLDGGTLRFAKAPELRADCGAPKRLGIFLPNDMRQATELFDDVINNDQPSFEFLIKYHPDLLLDFKMVKSNVQIFSRSARELYGIVNGVVYCSSSAGLEAHSYGIPVFRFQGQFVDLRMGEYVFEPRVIVTVNDISDQDLELHQENNLFSPVNHSVWVNIFNSESDSYH